MFNPLSANPTKWSNTLKQCVGNMATNFLSVFGHIVKLALKGLKLKETNITTQPSRAANSNLEYTILG